MDDKLKMYEAQAIAIEKQLEIDRLTREKEEMAEELRQLRLSINGPSSSKTDTGVKCSQDELRANLENQQQQLNKLALNMQQILTKIGVIENTLVEQAERTRTVERKVESISKQMKGDTILLVGGLMDDMNLMTDSMVVLSRDRLEWNVLKLTIPYAGSIGAVYLNNEIYILDNFGELFKIDKDFKWIQLAHMNVGRLHIMYRCLAWKGCIWVFGGHNDEGDIVTSVERYDPKEDKWTLIRDVMERRQAGSTALLWNEKIIVSTYRESTNSVECIDSEFSKFTKLPDLPYSIDGHSLLSYKQSLVSIGGFHTECCGDMWKLDSEKDSKWVTMPSMKYLSYFFTGIVLDDEIYAMGGRGDDKRKHDRVQIFDGESWRDGPSLPYKWSCMSAIIIPQSLADHLCSYKLQ